MIRKKNAFIKLVSLVSAMVIGMFALSACSSDSASENSGDQIIRIGLPSPGDSGQQVWDLAIQKFKDANPDWDVELQLQDDDIYSTIGLQNLLTGGNPPDAYFEWAGARTVQRFNDGFALDLSSYLADSGISSLFDESALSSGEVDGKPVLLPLGADVTNVIWYDKDVFAEYNLSVPTTWDELMEISATLKSNGVTPFSVGNKDLWVAGNLFGHVYSRVAGDDVYHKVLTKQMPMNSPEMVKAFGVVEDLKTDGYINASANSIADNEGYTLFFQGGAAMLPIGSWLVGIAADEAPEKNIDWFNMPAFTDGAGDQGSVIGVSTGYVINANSTKIEKTLEFFEIFFSDEVSQAWMDAGFAPLTKYAAQSYSNPLQARLAELMNSGALIVAPPDTGYDLKIADALNTATAQVLDGVKSPADALAEAQTKIDNQ